MLEDLFQKKVFPSPLIIEGFKHSIWMEKMASHVLCESQSSCGECRSCRLLKSKNHPDWIEAEGDIKLDDLRHLLVELRRKSFQSPFRVLAIRNFHLSTAFVQNALLKTLEEPHSHWVIILGVDSSTGLLPTVRSRCLFYKLENNTGEEISAASEKIFKSIEDANDIFIYSDMENYFKSRERSKELWSELLQEASRKSYPGFWIKLAPFLEEASILLDRNLNPKVLWEDAWAKASHEAH